MLQLIIIEDEYPAADRLQKMLHRCDHDIQIQAVLPSVKEAVSWFQENTPPDLVLSDIQLSDGLSFEIFQKINLKSPIIFTTAYDEYAIRAFRVNSLDYLLKPIKKDELDQALTKYTQHHSSSLSLGTQDQLTQLLQSFQPETQYKSRLLVSYRDAMIPIPTADIAYFHSQHEWVYAIHQDGRKFPLDQTLEALQSTLDPQYFFRLNRQFIAHLKSISKVQPSFNGKLSVALQPSPETDVHVSREKAKRLKAWLAGEF